MKVSLIACTSDAINIACAAASRCYSELDNDELLNAVSGKTDDEKRKYLNGVMGSGHMSPIEHVTYTFMIEDVSRSFLAQISRHRLASFSVQSQRYVRVNTDIGEWYFMPPLIEKYEDCKQVFVEQMASAANAYAELVDKLVLYGHDEKAAQEEARYVLPEATYTKMVVTMNARELLHFFNLRCCNRAQYEIREVAKSMLKLAKQVTPELMKGAGASCVKNGVCPEGKHGCGHSQYKPPKPKFGVEHPKNFK